VQDRLNGSGSKTGSLTEEERGGACRARAPAALIS
jgi:hypothetical protein